MSDAYQPLKKLFHKYSKSYADAENSRRRESYSAIHWPFKVGEEELFVFLHMDVVAILENVWRNEYNINKTWSRLPLIARQHYLTGLLVEEILATNDIEGVHSTRKDIELVLSDPDSPRVKRFREMAQLYQTLLTDHDNQPTFPASAADIRDLYDGLLSNEISEEDKLDGKLFRSLEVLIVNGSKIGHRPPLGEKEIESRLDVFVQSQHESENRIINALIGHFMFEYTHPFYDGNGRTGRFLLAFRMLSILSAPTSMSLSHQFSAQRSRYYAAFQETEHPLNHAEATFFLESLLGMLSDAQDNLLDSLRTKESQLAELFERVSSSDFDDYEQTILSPLGQAHLFGPARPVPLKYIEEFEHPSWNTLRNAAESLVQRGVIKAVRKKPLIYALTPRGLKLLGLK